MRLAWAKEILLSPMHLLPEGERRVGAVEAEIGSECTPQTLRWMLVDWGLAMLKQAEWGKEEGCG